LGAPRFRGAFGLCERDRRPRRRSRPSSDRWRSPQKLNLKLDIEGALMVAVHGAAADRQRADAVPANLTIFHCNHHQPTTISTRMATVTTIQNCRPLISRDIARSAASPPLARLSEAQRQDSTESNEGEQDQDQGGLRVVAHGAPQAGKRGADHMGRASSGTRAYAYGRACVSTERFQA
jgi:hypothetical protein